MLRSRKSPSSFTDVLVCAKGEVIHKETIRKRKWQSCRCIDSRYPIIWERQIVRHYNDITEEKKLKRRQEQRREI
jgi:hypothetical protein